MGIASEARFAIDACRRTFANGDAQAHPDIGTVDWDRFLAFVRFHRVQGLVHESLEANGATLPDAIREQLAGDARAIAAANLRSVGECAALMEQSRERGVDLLFLKGLTLGALAYGKIATKAAADIDILVPEEQIGEAAALLSSSGYRLVIPKSEADASAIRLWHRHHKESLWAKADSGFLDLHTGLSDSPQLVPSIGISSPRQLVEVAPGVALPTLASDELFAYLCVHGGSSAWFRLKWIADLAAWTATFRAGELERLYYRSQQLGAGRSAALALLVADMLFGMFGNSRLSVELRRQRVTGALARAIFRQLVRPDAIEPTASALGTWRIHLNQLLLVPGASGKMSELRRQARAALFRSIR